MKWVTREKVKVDRVACPWLIRKFIDPKAEFLIDRTDDGEGVELVHMDLQYSVAGAVTFLLRRTGSEKTVNGK
jgi:hypothetical protein